VIGAAPGTGTDAYGPAFGPLVIAKLVAPYGAKSSSVARKNWLLAVNSAWWPLPSGGSETPDDSRSSGSGFTKSVSPRKIGLAGSLMFSWT
jgi:hypothetical protein